MNNPQDQKKIYDTNKILSQSKYHKPDANSVGEMRKRGGIQHLGDWIPQQGFIAFVVPECRAEYIPEPNFRYFAITDATPFEKGSLVFVDLVGGRSSIRKVKMKDGNILMLEDPLPHLPKIGGYVMKISGKKSDIIKTL